MEELKLHIQQVMRKKFKNNKNFTETTISCAYSQEWLKEHFLSAHFLVSFCYLVSNFLLQDDITDHQIQNWFS